MIVTCVFSLAQRNIPTEDFQLQNANKDLCEQFYSDQFHHERLQLASTGILEVPTLEVYGRPQVLSYVLK